MAPGGKFKSSIGRMSYQRPSMEKRVMNVQKSWKEVSKMLNSFHKKK